jgi:hypothetical protein
MFNTCERCVGVTVGRDHLDAQPLELDGHFLAELAAAEEQHAGGGGRQRRAEGDGRRHGGGAGHRGFL